MSSSTDGILLVVYVLASTSASETAKTDSEALRRGKENTFRGNQHTQEFFWMWDRNSAGMGLSLVGLLVAVCCVERYWWASGVAIAHNVETFRGTLKPILKDFCIVDGGFCLYVLFY